MKFAIVIIQTGSIHYQVFSEIAEVISGGLDELGYQVIHTDDLSLTDVQYILFGVNFCDRLQIELPKNSIIYNLEQIDINSPCITSGYLDYLFQYPIWDYSLINVNVLKSWGITNIQYLPVGYTSKISRINFTENKDIDVLFYGSINERRQKIIDELQSQGVTVEVLFGVYGQERDNYISRAKIVLNIHFHEAQVFEIVRVSYLLANKVFVVSETGKNTQEEAYFKEGLIFSDYDNLVDNCLTYLKEDETRDQIAQKGFDLMKNRPASEYLKTVIPSISLFNNKSQTFIKDFYRKRQAKICFDQNKYESAIALYEQSVQVDPNCLDSYWYLGLCFMYQGDDFSAQLTWGTGISQGEELDIKEEEIINNLANILLTELAKQRELNNQDLIERINLHLAEIV